MTGYQAINQVSLNVVVGCCFAFPLFYVFILYLL